MQQLDPRAVWLFFISFILRWFFLIIIFAIWGYTALLGIANGRTESLSDFFGLFLLLFPIFIIACFIWAKLSFYFYRYELTEAGFRKESGVIYKKYVTIPYDRIQNVDIYRGILARILGLSDLNIQTAGNSAVMNSYGIAGAGIGAEGRLPALSKETAELLRDELIQRTRQSKNQGL